MVDGSKGERGRECCVGGWVRGEGRQCVREWNGTGCGNKCCCFLLLVVIGALRYYETAQVFSSTTRVMMWHAGGGDIDK